MLLSFQSIGNTVSAHPWLTLFLFLLTSALVLHQFAEVSLGEVFSGVLRLLGSIFAAPFHFIRSAVGAVAGFAADDGADARSRTYLLHRSIEYTRLATLVAAILLVATGLVVAILGVWPSAQLEQRTMLKAQLASVDSAYAIDSMRLAELTSSGQAELARKREVVKDSLRTRRDGLATSVTQFWKSVDNTVPAPEGWAYRLDSAAVSQLAQETGGEVDGSDGASVAVASTLMNRLIDSEPGEAVWNDDPYPYRYTEDSALVAMGASIRRSLGDLLKADSAWAEMSRGFLLALSSVETQHTLVNILRTGSTEQEVEAINLRQTTNAAQRQELQQALGEIKWFAGVTFFFLTLLYTYLLFVAFVWLMGIAIETTLLFVGIAQDIAAMRKRAE
jgi:hypothetical protein